MKRNVRLISTVLALVMLLLSVASCQNNNTPVEPGTNIPIIKIPEPTPERFAGTAVRFEAEDYSNGVENCPWASGGKFVGGFESKKNSRIEFDVYCSTDTEVMLVFCIANTSSSAIFFEEWGGFLKINNANYTFGGDVLVNDRDTAKGERYADMYPDYASTAPYLMFERVEVVIELNSGYNTVTFVGGATTFNFDYIDIVPESDRVQIR